MHPFLWWYKNGHVFIVKHAHSCSPRQRQLIITMDGKLGNCVFPNKLMFVKIGRQKEQSVRHKMVIKKSKTPQRSINQTTATTKEISTQTATYPNGHSSKMKEIQIEHIDEMFVGLIKGSRT